jgi:dipeptidase E
MPRRLLLISNSTLHGGGYLDHAAAEIRDFLGSDVRRVLFVPYALHDRDGYARKARTRFEAMGYAMDSVHEASEPAEAAARAEAFFVGGGNTFRLLDSLHRLGLLPVIQGRVGLGMPYVGSSAGSNVACPTLKTTKDMPIVEPPSFDALGLVGFQISPHFQDRDRASTHMGETQEERIVQYLEENDRPVAGLREGAMLRVEDGKVLLKGSSGMRVFRRGHQPTEVKPVADVGDLLEAPAADAP